MRSETRKDLSLEAVRGAAAFVVFIWHFFLAFDAAFLFDPAEGLVGTPLFAFFHGTAAVDLFFVLSGFVLTRRYFESGADDLLITGAAKRWFRLMPVVLISVLLSWVCFRMGWYAYGDAAGLSHSAWLAACGGSREPPVDASFFSALWQGFFDAIIRGEATFNSNLWTLHIEFWGSLLAFGFAWAVRRAFSEPALVWMLCLIVGVVASYVDLHYLAFVVGTLLAAYAPRLRPLKPLVGAALLLAALMLFGYRAPLGFYDFLMPIAVFPRDNLYTLFSIAASVCLILACIGWPALNKSMQSAFARFLGQISFPLYALQIVMIASLGSAVFVAVGPNNPFEAKLITALALFPATIVLAYGLSLFDAWWVRRLNRFAAQRFKLLRKARA